jgi:ubiquinone/menaquinone biosynthesis C-methylase UbiE
VINKVDPRAEAVVASHRDYQGRVDSYFDSRSSDWAEIYTARSVEGVIYQRRKAVVLRWIDNLALPEGSRILEVGCGAGLTTIELARRGYLVNAIDSSEAMVERALRGATESDVGDRVKVSRGDAHSLPFEDNLFGLVVAIGVIPWIESPGTAVREMARVVKPGGYVVMSADNRARLNHLLDPRWNPALSPLRRFLKHVLERTGLRNPRSFVPSHFHSTSYIDRVVLESRLEKTKAVTLGFGPFSFLGRMLLPDLVGIRLNRRLQALANRGVPAIRSTGSQYLILARKR